MASQIISNVSSTPWDEDALSCAAMINGSNHRPKRRSLIVAFVCFFFSLAVAAYAADKDDAGNKPSDFPGYSMDDLRKMADLIQRTGISADKIPSINKPRFLSISAASLSMDNEEIVFVVHYPGNLVRIYPRRIMLWHEAVNDILPDSEGNLPSQPVPGVSETTGGACTLTYSPLTGAVVAFHSKAGRYATSFGISGNLLNGNSVLYDRISRSLWSQLMAVCLEGPLRGKRLERIPVLWARWGGVKERYGGLDSSFSGKAEVLSRATGHKRSYGKDPYGSYDTPGNYYDNNRLPFPVSHLDSRLPPKTAILGVEADSAFGAIRKDAVKQTRVLNFSLGAVPMVAVYDEGIDAIRVFGRQLPGQEEALSFIIFEDKLVDEQTKSEWLPDGTCTYGRFKERTLSPVIAIDAMWFAWASFYRGSRIFPDKDPSY